MNTKNYIHTLGALFLLLGLVLVMSNNVGVIRQTHVRQLASLQSAESIGNTLGSIVNDVVLDIHAHHPESRITQAHVLAIMCQELPSLQIDGSNGEGRQEGFTQVITSTYNGLISGSTAEGACTYTANLEIGQEGGPCSSLDARTHNARCSIEVGACLYDYLLIKCNGDISCAYNAYNTGSIYTQANGSATFAQGYENLTQGQMCDNATYNNSIWSGIMRTVSMLTGGTFKTNGAISIPVSKNNLTTSYSPLLVTNNNSAYSNNPTTYSQDASHNQPVSGGNTDGVVQNYQPANTIKNLLSPISTSTSDIADVDIYAPKLVCVPESITPNEQVIIMYACTGKGVRAEGENFSTGDKTYGAVRVTPSATTVYSLTCIDGLTKPKKALCTVTVNKDSLL